MSPSAALHDPIFRAYLEIVVGVLIGAGLVLAILQFVFRIELGSVWETYCSWLWIAPLAAFCIFAGRVPIIIGATVVALLGCNEFARISGLARDRWMTAAVYAAILLVNCGGSAIIALLFIFLVPILRNRSASVIAEGDELRGLSLGMIAFILLGLMWGDLRSLANSPHAYGYLCYLIFATGVADVSGFVFGKMFGRHALRSEISPHKTWEGALGALAISMALPWFLRFSFPFFGPWQLLLTGLIVGLGGQIGDLAFSALKRDFGVKNWSAAIPGHGGVLDRIDSLIFVAPLFMLMTGHYYPGQ